jgi:TonB family protein
MKTLITLILLSSFSVMAQVKESVNNNKTLTKKEIKQKKTANKGTQLKKKVSPLAITTDPVYPGGMTALDEFVKSNFKMSRKDRKKQVEGDIMVKFTITTDGSVKNAKILNGGMSEKLNKEALRVINILPTWTAGTMNGTAVDVMYAYTISVGK